MPLIRIDTEACVQCGLCRDACGDALISFIGGGEYPRVTSDIETRCIRCGHCVAVCPAHCLNHADLPNDQCLEIDKELVMSAAAVFQLLRSRRSIRRYQDKSVPRSDIEKLFDVVRFAPTGHNDQDVRWRVFDQRSSIKAISDATVDFFKVLVTSKKPVAAPLDFPRLIDAYEKGIDVILRGTPVLVVAHSAKSKPMGTLACQIALTTLELAAKGFGLGTCWAGLVMFGVMSGFAPLLTALSLPEEQQLAGCMMLGYPELVYRRIPPRKPADITWHDTV